VAEVAAVNREVVAEVAAVNSASRQTSLGAIFFSFLPQHAATAIEARTRTTRM
jgi:hypothetical protein